MPGEQGVLGWLHIGDLHITQEAEQNYLDLKHIVDLAKGLPAGSVDFAVLPGDNADDGTPEQFRLVRDAVATLPMPLHILPGDHDFKPRALDAFHDVLGAERLPKSVVVHRHRCLFLDVVSAGAGGPDFRLGEAQLVWAERELADAEAAGQDAVVFMHTYPADLREGAERLRAPLARTHVTCVDMGHTHYNELANDDATIFMATRSTGQIEEGPPGFSIAAVDGPVPGGAALWEAPILADASRVAVRTRDAKGRQDEDRVEPVNTGWTPPERQAGGSDADRVGAWPERNITGTQLGLNRNGRKW